LQAESVWFDIASVLFCSAIVIAVLDPDLVRAVYWL
jgi:hypothetical protein